MTYTFNAQEKSAIQTARSQCPVGDDPTKVNASGNWVPFYTLLSNILGQHISNRDVSGTDLQDFKNAKLWLDAAIGANGGTGMHSAFIRTFTDRQGELRRGSAFSDSEMQKASNGVALNLYLNIAGKNLQPGEVPEISLWTVPSISQIAKADASSIGRNLFGAGSTQPLVSDDDAILSNSAWSGTLGFNMLGGAAPYESWRLLVDPKDVLNPQAAKVDTLDDFKNLLYAVDSFQKGWTAGFKQSGQDFANYVAASLYKAQTGNWPTDNAGPLAGQVAISFSTGNLLGLVKDVAARTPTISPVVNAIADVGVNKFLDMLMGAVQGKSLIGTTTDATFATNAKGFLGALSPAQLQILKAELLPTAPDALASKASANTADGTNTRAALAALSVVSVQVSDTVAANFTLYDPATGQGNITSNWITDRAAFTAKFYEQQQRGGGIVPGKQNIVYIDKATNTQVLVGAGSAQRTQVIFGGDANDVIDGQAFADALYGGSGADTLDGKGGNDYLDGGAGDDILIGGDGSDRLYGGSGSDTYELQVGSGIDTIADSGAGDILKLNGKVITGSFSSVDGLGGYNLYSTDKAYELRQMENNTWRLSALDAATGAYTSVADLANWSSGKYGLTTGTASTTPRQDLSFPNGSAYFNMDASQAAQAMVLGGGIRSDSFYGSAFNDVINTGGGLTNYVSANGGDDLVIGGDGRDFIRTGNLGNLDNDVAYGGGDSDVLMGGGGDDQLWGGNDNADYLSTDATSAARGDWLSGENGNDTLYGSRSSDVMFGGAGDDLLEGGAGDDLMLGDAQYTPYSKATGLSYAQGSTLSYKWDSTQGGMTRLSESNYALSPVVFTSGLAFGWEWSKDATGDFTLTNPANMVVALRTITGGGSDVLDGGAGNDWMAGQTGNDLLYGGDGNDILYGDDVAGKMAAADEGDDLLYGEAGDDQLYGGGGDDILDGGTGNDLLYGEAGQDQLQGGDGRDTLDGGDGDDTLEAGAGDDTLIGGAGTDFIEGGLGQDTMQGGLGDDLYWLTRGDDKNVVSTITDADGANVLDLNDTQLQNMKLTGAGTNWLLRYSLDDTVQLNGNFTVNLGGKNYTMEGLQKALTPPPPENHAPTAASATLADQAVPRNAFYTFTVPASQFADEDVGDVLSYSATQANGAALPAWLHFDAATRTFSGQATASDASSLQLTVTATDTAGASASSSFGLSLQAPANHAPTLVNLVPTQAATEASAFTFKLPTATFTDPDVGDKLTYKATLADGQALPSWLTFDAATQTFSGTPLHANAGTTTINIIATDAGGLSANGLFDLKVTAINIPPPIEVIPPGALPGTAGNDTLSADSTHLQVYGLAGDDLINGFWGSTTLVGGAGNDTINAIGGPANVLDGGDGDDILIGGWGYDTFLGGSGNNTINVTGGGATVTAGAGNDRVNGGWGDDDIRVGDGNNVVNTGGGNNFVLTGSGDDILTGDWGNDTLIAGAGNNRINAGGGRNLIVSGAGNDVITAQGSNVVLSGAGNDSITLTWANNWVDAGQGDDLIDAGGGYNLFAFNRGDGADTIANTSWSASTLSLGEGISAADMKLKKDGNNLVLDLGSSGSSSSARDSITLKDWYTRDANHGVGTLQMLKPGTGASGSAGSGVNTFNFTQLVQNFDVARAANPAVANGWAATGGLGATQMYANDVPPANYVNPWVALQAGTDLVTQTAAIASNPITTTGTTAAEQLLFAALNTTQSHNPARGWWQ